MPLRVAAPPETHVGTDADVKGRARWSVLPGPAPPHHHVKEVFVIKRILLVLIILALLPFAIMVGCHAHDNAPPASAPIVTPSTYGPPEWP